METLSPVQAFSDVLLVKHYQLASVVILFFDYLLTLDLEWENIWKRKWTFATLLFFINRYFPMLSYIVVIVSLHDPSWSEKSCEEFIRLPFYMVLVSETVIAMIVSLRLYALYLHRWQVPVGLGFVYLCELSWAILGSRGLVMAPGLPAGQGCVAYVDTWAIDLFAGYVCTSAIFDCIVLVLTLYETLRFRPKGLKIPLADLFLRDGILYFATMFAVKVGNVIISFTVSRNLITISWTLNHTITVIMISRLVLNLREHDSQRRKASGTSASYDTVSMLYASVIGNLGAAIDADEANIGGKDSFESDRENLKDGFPVEMRWPEADNVSVDWHDVVSVHKLNYTGHMV